MFQRIKPFMIVTAKGFIQRIVMAVTGAILMPMVGDTNRAVIMVIPGGIMIGMVGMITTKVRNKMKEIIGRFKMKVIVASIMVLLSVGGICAADSIDCYVITRDVLAADSSETYDLLVTMSMNNEQAGAMELIRRGKITLIKKGEKVHLAGVSMFGPSEIRRHNESKRWFIPSSAKKQCSQKW